MAKSCGRVLEEVGHMVYSILCELSHIDWRRVSVMEVMYVLVWQDAWMICPCCIL